MSWPIPVTLKLQWSAIHVSCPLGGLRTKCLKDRSIPNAATQLFSTWIRPNQSGCSRVVHASKLFMRYKAILNFDPAVPVTPQRCPPSPAGAAAKQTATLFIHSTLSMRVGLGATAVEPRAALLFPHSSPRQRGRVRWLVTRQFLSAIPILTCQEFETHLGVRIVGLGNARLLEATFPLQQVFFWSVHLPNKPALSFRFLYFGGGEREDMKKRYWGWGWEGGVCRILQLLFTSLSSTIKGREKLKE